jgi:gluconate 2-dehydrogenase gamma chain
MTEMQESSDETVTEGQGITRRRFVRIVRDSAIVLMLPQVPACRSVSEHGTTDSDGYEIRFFSAVETAVIDAVTDRIIPKDGRPGARDAQVVHFIDHMLSTSYSSQQAVYRNGIRQLDDLSQGRFHRPFTDLADAEKDALLAQIERGRISNWKDAGEFFATVRIHTIEGMFSDPKYHGNAARVGWQLLGVYD